MACRGISFVDNKYVKHLTDMIYVPSGGSHVTRNVQDMRIYGNFIEDGIKINLYVDEDLYLREIKNYITLQKELLSGNKNYDPDSEEPPPSLKCNIMSVRYRLQLPPDNLFKIPTKINNFSKTRYNRLVLENLDLFNK